MDVGGSDFRFAALGRGSGEPSRHPGLGEGAALTLVWRNVIGAGFALPRGAGPKTGVPWQRAIPELGSTPSRPAARGGAGVNTGVPLPIPDR